MMSFNSFSQKDTTKIQLDSKTTKLIIKDLIEGDAAKKELEITREKISLFEAKIALQGQIIFAQNKKHKNLLLVIDNGSKQLGYAQASNLLLQQDLKKEKSKNKVFAIGGGVAIVGVIVLAALTAN